MAWNDLDLLPIVAKSVTPKAPIISFTKAGRMTLFPKASDVLEAKEGDGINFTFNDTSKACYVFKDAKSPLHLKKSQSKNGRLYIQNQKLVDYIRTAMKVGHGDLFRVELDTPGIKRTDSMAFLMSIQK